METEDGYTIGYHSEPADDGTRVMKIRWDVVCVSKGDYQILIHMTAQNRDHWYEFQKINQMYEDGMSFEAIKAYYEL